MSTAQNCYRIGLDRFRAGEFAGAVEKLREGLASDPAHVESLRTLGMALYRLERYADALEVGRRLVETAPDDVLSYTTLSLFLQKNGRIQEAEQAATKAKLLAWKRQLKDGTPEAGQGLQVLDATPPSPPVMPVMPARRKPEHDPDSAPGPTSSGDR